MGIKKRRIKLERKLKRILHNLCENNDPRVIEGRNFEYHTGKSGCLVFVRDRATITIIFEYNYLYDSFIDNFLSSSHIPTNILRLAILDFEKA